MNTTVRRLVYRTRRALARHGLRGAVQKVARRGLDQVAFSESHVWYELSLTEPRPARTFESGVVLRRAGDGDLQLLDGLPTISPVEGAERIRAGNDLWLVLDGNQPLFSCWIFWRQTPVMAAPGGQLQLPERTVCLEDSVTAAAARGRGIAPAAWAAIADTLAEDGQQRMITKVAVENTPSRRAVEKAGFAAVAVMHFRRLGPLTRTSVALLDGERASFLVASLGARQIGS